MPKVNVIIPAYNVSQYIARALKSVLNQDYKDIEIIIVNDGSTDNLENVLEPYLSDRRIKYFATENRGPSHAINVGMKSVSADYICVLHADDLFLPGKVGKQLGLMERSPKFDISYTSGRYFLETDGRSVKSPYPHFSGDIFYFIKRSNFIHMSTTMFRKRVFDDVSFDEGLLCHEDWDLFLKLSRKGVRFMYLDEALSRISVRQENLSSNTIVMDSTRCEVGKRAKRLWRAFKKDINLYSMEGISNLKRYITSKIYAFAIGFPNRKNFNRKSPREILRGGQVLL